MLLSRVLRPLIRTGRLTVIDAHGTPHVFGTEAQPAITVRLHDPKLHWKLALNPGLYAGEAWMDGTLTVEDGSLYDFLDLFGRNLGTAGLKSFKSPLRHLKRLKRGYHRLNDRWRSERNVAHHYDLSDEMYGLFLDSERQYTCAYHPTGAEDIETAQRLKEQHIAAKLRLEPGMRVADLGCGWGSLAMYLARHHDVDVTAVTLSKEQVARGNARAREMGLADRARLLHKDYREVEGTFDRVVSIGMLEHVGVRQYGRMFERIRALLPQHGVALVHSIGRVLGPGSTNPWIKKYIFPGGYIPALSEVLPSIERSGLWVTDIEVLRLHYAYTLKQWRERFVANWDKAAALYDERFCRMWEFYLIASEFSFRYGKHMVFQIQMTKAVDTLPLDRGYMAATEAALPAWPKAGH